MARIILFLLALSLMPAMAQDADPAAAAAQARTDTILVFDASGSMWAQIDGINKIVIARDVVSELLRELPASQRMGLIAYGHNRKGDCSDIEMLAPVGADLGEIATMVQNINPKGMTPMTDAVIQAAEALKYTENKATVILVSDGEETCHADPCEAARRLAELGVGLTVHTVGFGLESAEAEAAEQQLQCIAEATDGKFFSAQNAQELTAALTKISQAEAQPEPEPEPPATVEVKLTATDQENGPVIENGLVWTIFHGASGEKLYQSEPGGSITVDIPKGVHDVSVVRLEDEASAEGEIITGADGTHVILPIIVDYNVSLEAPEQAVVGSQIRVTWTGPEDDGDYIGIATLDGNPRWSTESTPVDQGNPLQLQVPAEPGDYRIMYVRKQQGYAALTEQPFKVIEAASSVSAPDTAIAGESITVEWTGPEYDGDYIAIAKVDDNPRWPTESTRIDQGSPLQVRVPANPGDYRVMYVMKHGYRALAEQPLEVTQTQASVSAPDMATAGDTIRV
ncbi:MAG TPA: VWA domain-containing protein, partial [Salinisphaeraceae bacterium]|nr:VWA domain-containing protein [Salinisphaeraceae bacterium]